MRGVPPPLPMKLWHFGSLLCKCPRKVCDYSISVLEPAGFSVAIGVVSPSTSLEFSGISGGIGDDDSINFELSFCHKSSNVSQISMSF